MEKQYLKKFPAVKMESYKHPRSPLSASAMHNQKTVERAASQFLIVQAIMRALWERLVGAPVLREAALAVVFVVAGVAPQTCFTSMTLHIDKPTRFLSQRL